MESAAIIGPLKNKKHGEQNQFLIERVCCSFAKQMSGQLVAR